MSIQDRNIPGTTTRAREDLDRLIRGRGLSRYGLFFGTGEGRRLPNGSEDASGYVIDDRGRVFFYWLDWDERRGEVTFTDWEEVQPEPDWLEEAEYCRARTAAGLSD